LSATSIKIPGLRGELHSTGTKVKTLVNDCGRACTISDLDEITTKSGTLYRNHNMAYCVPRNVKACGEEIAVAFLTLGHPSKESRNIYAQTFTNRVFKMIHPEQVMHVRTVIEAKRVIPATMPVPLSDSFFLSTPHVELASLELLPLESRPLSERLLGVDLRVPEIIR
jgi:hypothetical protein